MYKILLLSLFLGSSFLVFSQQQGGNGQMRAGTLFGKVVDSASGKGLEATSIQLIQSLPDSVTKTSKDVVVTGALTDARGNFRIENIPAMGNYKLLISGIGYKTYSTNFSFIDRSKMNPSAGNGGMAGALDRDLGNIRLAPDNQVLEGVTVTGTKPSFQLGIDRKIFNVENNLIAAGGTAVDVLRTVPSVSVDIDGNISVRNGSPQIFVDGRPTTLTLDQIPADQIETVEVITNPSAKYDASGGMAGILNIVLKKTRRVGYSGNVRGGVDQRGKVNFGGNFNVRQGKINFFANAMYNQRKRMGTGETERTSTRLDSTFKMTQIDKSADDGVFMFGRAGFDYFIDNRNTLTISGLAMQGRFDNNSNSTILSDTTATGMYNQSKILRETARNFRMHNTGGSLSYLHNFPQTGHQLTADLNYSKFKNENGTDITNKNFASSSGPQTGTFKQRQAGLGDNQRLTAQIDYANPITKNSKFETGVRLNQSELFNENNLSFVSPSGELIPQLPLSSKFNYTDRVWAGYANYASKIGENFGYQVGLRLESSDYNGDVTSYSQDKTTGVVSTLENNFHIQYPISLFPSIFLSQQLKNDQSLQLNYSRRINRPGFFQLFPFIMDYSDSLNISRGNAGLKPEFTNSFEVSYAKNFNRVNNLIFSVYYKHTAGLITRYQLEESSPLNDKKVIVTTYENANSAFVSGFEAISKNKLADWWDLTSNLNIYTSKIDMDDPNITNVGQIWSWFGKLNNDFKLPKNFTVQISTEYSSKRVLAAGGSGGGGGGGGFRGGGSSGSAQGYSMPNLDVDGSVKYEFLKDKRASLTLSVRDIFRSDYSEVYTFTPLFDQHSIRRRDAQFFQLNFAYRFGKFDASLFKRRNTRNDQDMQSGGMENMGQ